MYLVDILVLLSGLQGDLRAPVEAHERPAQRALAIGRRLVAEDPDGYRPALITALRRLGSGEPDPALGIARGTEAVQLARQQAGADIDSGLPLLVAALQDVSVQLAAGGREAEGVAAFVEASSIQRHLPLPDTPDPARVPHSPRVPPGDQGARVDTLIAVSDVICQLRHRTDDPARPRHCRRGWRGSAVPDAPAPQVRGPPVHGVHTGGCGIVETWAGAE